MLDWPNMMGTLLKENTLLKLEVVIQKQETWKKEIRWNELKGELNAILDVVLLLTLNK